MPNAQSEDISLLHHDFDQLLAKYQTKIKLIARKCILKGLFYLSDEADIIQNINEQLLKRKEKIQQQYVQKASVGVYFNAIINNICIDLYRKEKKKISIVSYPHHTSSSPFFSVLVEKEDYLFNRLIIQEELEKLSAILKTFPKHQAKLALCLKLISGVTIQHSDILYYHPNHPKQKLNAFLTFLETQAPNLTDKLIYEQLNHLFNEVENKTTTVDAVKKWIEYKVKQMIYLLNNHSNYANYDKSSFKILLKMYYEPKEEELGKQYLN